MNTVLFMLQNTFQNTKETIALLAFLSCLHFYKYGSHGQEQNAPFPLKLTGTLQFLACAKLARVGFF